MESLLRYLARNGLLLAALAALALAVSYAQAATPVSAPAASGATTPKKATFYQDAIEMTVTRGAPFGLGGSREVDVPLRTKPDGTGNLAVTKLLSGNRHVVNATLGPPKGGHAKLTVQDPPAAGKYAGKLRSSNARADDLGLTVHVQDWFVWPLLVVVAGAILAGLGLRRYEWCRRRRVLERAISAARVKWVKETESKTAPEALDDFAFDEEAEKVLKALKKARSFDGRETAVKEATAFLDRATRWLRLAQVLRELQAALDALSARHGAEAPDGLGTVLGDTEAMLAQRYSADNPKTADASIKRIEDQSLILHLYAQALGLKAHPAEVYGQYPPECRRTRPQTRHLTEELASQVRCHFATRRKPPTGLQFLSVDVVHMASALRMSSTVPEMETLIEDLAPPEEIERSIRRGDWTAFALQGLVLATAYVLTIYPGKDFGSCTDYLTAFTAGAAGKLALPWDLVFRSTRPPAATAATAPAKPAAT